MRVIRSEPRVLESNQSLCGNCHGTGSEGLGLLNTDPCNACEGRGWHKIDPNAKTYTLAELLEMI